MSNFELQDVLFSILEYLDLKDKIRLSCLNKTFFFDISVHLERLLCNTVKQIEPVNFIKLIEVLWKNKEFAYAILKSPELKHILISQRPSHLPHWMLHFPDYHPEMLPLYLKDPTISHSLTENEKQYLSENYSKQVIKSPH